MNLVNACMIGLVELCTDKTDKDWKQFSLLSLTLEHVCWTLGPETKQSVLKYGTVIIVISIYNTKLIHKWMNELFAGYWVQSFYSPVSFKKKSLKILCIPISCHISVTSESRNYFFCPACISNQIFRFLVDRLPSSLGLECLPLWKTQTGCLWHRKT